MSLRTTSAVATLVALLLIGCDSDRFDSPDPDVAPTRTDTQLPVTDGDYISPDSALPRPESPRQPEYPVAPAPDPSAGTEPDPAEQPPTPDAPPAGGTSENQP